MSELAVPDAFSTKFWVSACLEIGQSAPQLCPEQCCYKSANALHRCDVWTCYKNPPCAGSPLRWSQHHFRVLAFLGLSPNLLCPRATPLLCPSCLLLGRQPRGRRFRLQCILKLPRRPSVTLLGKMEREVLENTHCYLPGQGSVGGSTMCTTKHIEVVLGTPFNLSTEEPPEPVVSPRRWAKHIGFCWYSFIGVRSRSWRLSHTSPSLTCLQQHSWPTTEMLQLAVLTLHPRGGIAQIGSWGQLPYVWRSSHMNSSEGKASFLLPALSAQVINVATQHHAAPSVARCDGFQVPVCGSSAKAQCSLPDSTLFARATSLVAVVMCLQVSVALFYLFCTHSHVSTSCSRAVISVPVPPSACPGQCPSFALRVRFPGIAPRGSCSDSRSLACHLMFSSNTWCRLLCIPMSSRARLVYTIAAARSLLVWSATVGSLPDCAGLTHCTPSCAQLVKVSPAIAVLRCWVLLFQRLLDEAVYVAYIYCAELPILLFCPVSVSGVLHHPCTQPFSSVRVLVKGFLRYGEVLNGVGPTGNTELGLRTNRNSLSASFTDHHLLSKAALHGHRELLLSRLQRAGRHYFLTRQLQGSHPASNACPEAVRQSFVQFMFLVANRSKSRHVLHCVLASGCLAASGSYVRVSPGLRPNAPCFKSWFKYKTFDGLFVCLEDNCWPQGFFLSPRWSSTCTPVESARTVAPSLVPSTPSWESTRKVRHRCIYFASHLRRQRQPIIWALLPLMNVVLWQLVSTTTCQKVCSNFCVKRREKNEANCWSCCKQPVDSHSIRAWLARAPSSVPISFDTCAPHQGASAFRPPDVLERLTLAGDASLLATIALSWVTVAHTSLLKSNVLPSKSLVPGWSAGLWHIVCHYDEWRWNTGALQLQLGAFWLQVSCTNPVGSAPCIIFSTSAWYETTISRTWVTSTSLCHFLQFVLAKSYLCAAPFGFLLRQRCALAFLFSGCSEKCSLRCCLLHLGQFLSWVTGHGSKGCLRSALLSSSFSRTSPLHSWTNGWATQKTSPSTKKKRFGQKKHTIWLLKIHLSLKQTKPLWKKKLLFSFFRKKIKKPWKKKHWIFFSKKNFSNKTKTYEKKKSET